MRQSIKTGVLERRAERKALYALIATCEKENIIKALEIIKADKNHSRAAHHYYKPFYFNLYKDSHLKSLISFSDIDNQTALNFLAFHYLRATLNNINTFIEKIAVEPNLIDFNKSKIKHDFFKLISIAACEHLAKQNKIDSLPNLTIKDLFLRPITNHEVFNAVPIDARHFAQLTFISLSKNAQHLQFFEPSKLVALKELYLSGIKISDALYFIEALPNLKNLRFVSNRYEGWEELKSNSLTSLTLSGNRYALSLHSLPDFSINIPNLSYLKLDGIYIKNRDNLAKLKKLKQLILKDCSYDKEKFVIPPLPLLYHLHLWGITNLDLAAISQISSLTQLKMYYCNLTDISFLATLHNLEDLDISYNKISDISLLSQFENLAKLNLSYNNITNISALEGLNKLREINLRRNTLTVYPPLRTSIWIKQYTDKNLFEGLEEPQEVTSLRALICSNDKNNIALAEQILFGMGWTETEFKQLVRVLHCD